MPYKVSGYYKAELPYKVSGHWKAVPGYERKQ